MKTQTIIDVSGRSISSIKVPINICVAIGIAGKERHALFIFALKCNVLSRRRRMFLLDIQQPLSLHKTKVKALQLTLHHIAW